jgi:hypothetical protein
MKIRCHLQDECPNEQHISDSGIYSVVTIFAGIELEQQACSSPAK